MGQLKFKAIQELCVLDDGFEVEKVSSYANDTKYYRLYDEGEQINEIITDEDLTPEQALDRFICAGCGRRDTVCRRDTAHCGE